jgi:PAS domain S-box-containing protein
MPIINYLQRQSTARLWLAGLIISVVMSEIITGIMSLILQGKVTYDYLLTGLVASFLVAGCVVAVLIIFLRKSQEDAKQLRIISDNLDRSEKRARQALLASHSALWDLDLTTWNVYLSDGWSPFLCGEERPTSTSLKVLNDLVPEEERPLLNEAIIAAMKGKNNSEYRVKHRVRKLDGNYIWVQSEGRVTERDQDGRALRMNGINRDITELRLAEDQIKVQIGQITQTNTQLLETNSKLEQTRSQLLQSEKMASIGQLAAGVAHEINNPIGYVNSNLGTLRKYLCDIFAMLDKCEAAMMLIKDHHQELAELREFRKKIRLAHLREETKAMLAESQEGLDRVRKIVLDLKDFSHTGIDEQWEWTDLQHGLESTLNVVWNELRYKCEVRKEYSPLPKIYCLPSRINQVFMNLLVNAAQAIEERGVVTIRTGQEGNQVWIEVADTGQGVDPKILTRIFDPFFTTKPVGKGTGLGLSLSYSIVEKHNGRIEVHSEVGKGSAFRVWLPVEHHSSQENASV